MQTLFGTDGVRGRANVEPMTGETAMKLGRAAASVFKNQSGGRHRIVIGKDTRISGDMLEAALTAGLCSMGVDVLLVGPIPTPAVAFLARSLRADAGVVISASHNPFDDNGIKFFCSNGFKLPDAVEREIERCVFSNTISDRRPTAAAIGKAFRLDDAKGRYVEYVKNSLPKGFDFEGMKVVVDCAHGAAYQVAPTILRELGAEVTAIGNAPNGVNINLDCGAVHPERLQKVVAEVGADIGIAHDGDADRVLFVDAQGRVIDGDAVLVTLALSLQRAGALKGNAMVATVMSNMGLEIALRAAGVRVVRSAVGDRCVLEQMVKNDLNFGGEPSGHVVFLDHHTTGDGLITAVQFLRFMKQTGKRASELADCMTSLPQVLLNVRVRRKTPLPEIPGMASLLADCETRLNGQGRLLVRYSGTEPLLRVMLEGESRVAILAMAGSITHLAEKHLGESEAL